MPIANAMTQIIFLSLEFTPEAGNLGDVVAVVAPLAVVVDPEVGFATVTVAAVEAVAV